MGGLVVYMFAQVQRMVCTCGRCDTREKQAMRSSAGEDKVKAVAQAIWRKIRSRTGVVAPTMQVQHGEDADTSNVNTLQYFHGPRGHGLIKRVFKFIGLTVGDGHFAIIPGGIFLEMGIVLAHIVTDLLSTVNLCRARAFWMASIVFLMYAYHMLKFRRVYRDLKAQLQKTLDHGFYTDPVLRLRDSQRGAQGVPVFMVALYGWIWAVNDVQSLCIQMTQLLLGMYGVAAFAIE